MYWGNKPVDGGNLILSEIEKDELLQAEPHATRFIRRFMSGGDFIDGKLRYCLWLVDAQPHELKRLPRVIGRIEQVKKFRTASIAAATRAYATQPTLFRQISQPKSVYLAIPEVSSERRAYIPMAMVEPDVICSNTTQFIPSATLFHFGVLTSAMHMAWVKRIAGRMKSDPRYSNSLVYNNFPWPPNIMEAQHAKVEQCAQAVLDARAQFPGSTLADLYDPLLMPGTLLHAHQALDRAVDRCYRVASFTNDQSRIEHLFALYEAIARPLLPRPPSKGRRKTKL
jgi:hypothetical protein